MSHFFTELKRRNVFRVGAAYIVVAWLIIQVTETIFPLFGFGDGPARLVVIVLVIGFVPVLILSWVFELTPEGLRRDSEVDPALSIAPHTGKKLDRMIMVVLVLALAYFAFDKFVLDPQRDMDITESATQAGAEQAREAARLGMFDDKSIAVLPFANRSENKEDEYFTDGMHDELLTRLSRIAALKVISRTSVMRFRDTLLSIPEIARELAVATILEGGVQRSGGQVRINVQLIDAHTDEHLWAEIYDRELTAENLFAIQSEISTAIADALEAALSPAEQSLIYDLPTTNMEAYNHFLRGRQSMANRNSEDMEVAHREFTRATELDPEFALAWVGVADTSHLLAFYGGMDEEEHVEIHRHAAEKALALNDQLGEAYASLANFYEDLEEGEKEVAAYLKAIELNPNYAQAYLWYAISLSGRESREKRLQLLYKAAQLDPMSSIIQYNLADMLVVERKTEEGREILLNLVRRDPEFAIGHMGLGWMYYAIGEFALAIQSFHEALRLDPERDSFMYHLGLVYVSLGDYEAVTQIREQLDQVLGEDGAYQFWLDLSSYLAQSNWTEGLARLATHPEQSEIQWAYQGAYKNAGDFGKARALLLELQPYRADRSQWQEKIIDEGLTNCEWAGILMESGDEALGQELLQLFLNNIQAQQNSDDPTSPDPIAAAMCHVLNGSIDQAMDILEPEIAQGYLINGWYGWGKDPWLRRLDHPRYHAMVEQINSVLAEQRALLEEMKESGALAP